jgi:hypothetical protein
VGAILKVLLFLFHHAQVRFMDERGRLQRVTGILVAHITPGHLPQFVVDERHQFVERLSSPLFHRSNNCVTEWAADIRDTPSGLET